ncbi:MAG: hypothetical protein COA42_11835 [Alteromonadaceae bacterium]|nr:MAG: hypothetical protein COA42_11835 [Alteromonadaceae bacterium]
MAVIKTLLVKTLMTNPLVIGKALLYRVLCALIILGSIQYQAFAAVLPEDRADFAFHSYEGDNSEFRGPSVLIRKQFANRASIWANYYVDMNSAASVDVETQGSAYTEERTEISGGIDFLHDRTLLSLSVTNSSENDYEADSIAFSLSQEFFGDLSTLSLSYSTGEDEVYQNVRDADRNIVDRTLEGEATHQRFSLGWTQIMTKSWILSLNAEASVDEGFLRNPYRSARALNNDNFTSIPELYPTTRNSQAYAIKSMYYLPYRAAIQLEYRVFNDSWDIEASNYQIKYIHPFGKHWITELRVRAYEQTQAEFYSDFLEFLPNEEQLQTLIRASDKELGTYDNITLGFALSYEVETKWLSWFDKVSVNFAYDRVSTSYDNFSDKRLGQAVNENDGRLFPIGTEPAFSFDADIVRMFLSFWY